MSVTKRRGRLAKKLWTILQESLGNEETVLDVWYEPRNGPCIEMQGYAGGWYYRTKEGGEDVLGDNYAEAVEMIRLSEKLRKSPCL